MEVSYEVIWMDASGVSGLQVRTTVGVTKATMAKMCADPQIVILTVRILWK